MFTRWVMLGLLTSMLLLGARSANADTIASFTTTSCGSSSCPLATYTATIHPTGGSHYTVALQIDIAAGATIVSGTNDHITSVNVKFASDLSAQALDLGASSGIGGVTWTTFESNINNSDCSGSGSGFVCSQAPGSGLPIAAGSTYKWVWNVTTASGASLTDGIHIGANYDPHNGYIISREAGISPPVSTPEPGMLTLLGAGLVGLVGIVSAARRLSSATLQRE